MQLLLISNSTNPGEPYLDYPKNNIREFLGHKSIRALFIPYAAVTFSYDVYEQKVAERFREIGHDIVSIHHFPDPVAAVRDGAGQARQHEERDGEERAAARESVRHARGQPPGDQHRGLERRHRR